MDRNDWTQVAHTGIDLMNPLPVEKLDEVIELLALERGARVIDLGCGKGELLRRLGTRYEIRAVGVDRSPTLLEEARRRAPGGVTYVVADLTAFSSGAPFDLAAALGASVGGFRATLERLAGHLRPGGLALLGEGYWRREPDGAYLEALGATGDEMTDYAGLMAAAAEVGLDARYAITASPDDFDRYEWRWSLNGERYAAANPDEPGVDDFLAWIRNGRRRFVELGGRETLGFGLFLFERMDC
jgi:SAM-dependent methyltransferase